MHPAPAGVTIQPVYAGEGAAADAGAALARVAGRRSLSNKAQD